MKILVVYAHPGPRSLNASLRDRMVATLTAEGHAVIVSDLHAQGWKASLDGADFPGEPGEQLDVVAASHRAFAEGTQPAEVAEEQRRLLWADAVILQFPLWWFSMPAILKGWVDRVYAHGFAYGRGEHSDRRWGDRYGEGVFAGKRAMLVVTTGGWEEHYQERGINGPIDDLLFPIQHGILFYPGFAVMDPFVVYRAGRMDAARFAAVGAELDRRMRGLFVEPPIAYRQQNGGDYEIPSMTLRAGLEQAGRQGFRLHRG